MRLAKRRNGEETKGRPLHIGRAILGGSTCFTNNLLQNVVRYMRHRQNRRNDAEQLFVSNWGKLENWHSNSIPGIKLVDYLGTEKMVGTLCGDSVSCSGKISRNLVAETFQRGAKRGPISRYSGDLD